MFTKYPPSSHHHRQLSLSSCHQLLLTTSTTTIETTVFNVDGYRLKYNAAQSQIKKDAIWQEWDAHQQMADRGYKWRSADRDRALEADSKTQMMVSSALIVQVVFFF